MMYRFAALCLFLVFSTSFNTIELDTTVENKSTEFYLSKTIKLKKITLQSCAKYETGNYTILVDKAILEDLKKQIPNSTYSKIVNNGIDTLDLNKIEGQNNRILLTAIIKYIENKEAIIINTDSGERVYKIKRRKYNRKTSSMRRSGGIEYIDAKTKSEILDLGLWMS